MHLDWSNKSTSSWSIVIGDPPSGNVKTLDWGQYDTVQLKIIVNDSNTEINRSYDEGKMGLILANYFNDDFQGRFFTSISYFNDHCIGL